MRKSWWIITLLLAVSIAPNTAWARPVTLDGSTVTGTLYNPDLGTILGGPATAVVGASNPTFPSGSIIGNSLFQINITGDKIFYDPLSNVTYGNGAFNGFVFVFKNAPDILGVTVDGLSNFSPADVSFTSDSVSLNLSGVTVNTSSQLILDVQMRSVPEPSSLALLGSGLAGLTLLRRKLFR